MTERLLSDLVANKEGLAADLQHEGPSIPAQKLQLSYTHTRTHARTLFFRDYPGEPVPER